MRSTLRAIGTDSGPSTTLMVREVENGYVIDVEMPGKPRPMGTVQTPPDVKTLPVAEECDVRFCKFVACSGVEMLNTLAQLLSKFESRKKNSSNRVCGNFNIDKRVAVVSLLTGGYLLDLTQKVQVKLSNTHRFHHLALAANAGGVGLVPPEQEIEVDETIQEIVVDLKDVLNRLGEFFGVKGE